MTDEPAPSPSPEPNPAQERVRVEPQASSQKTDFLPILYLVGFLALAGTLFYLWQHPPEGRLAPQEAERMTTLQSQVATLRDEVGKLDQRPAPAPSQAAFDKLQQQVNSLESKPSVSPEQLTKQLQALPKQPADLQPLTQRIEALEQRPQFDPAAQDKRLNQISDQMKQASEQVQQLSSRLDDFSGKLGQLQSRIDDEGGKTGQRFDQLSSRLDGLDKQIKQNADQAASRSNGLDGQIKQNADQTASRSDRLDKQIKQNADRIDQVAQKAQQAAKLQGAAAALAAGQKVGEIPGAPPALARFANEAPPTEASLRQSFDKYAAAAEKASQPAVMDNQDFGSRLWARAQQAVTVRQGDRVLLGDPIAGVISHARDQLDNGDLAGAMSALKGLAGPAAQAMQPWIEKAQSLLDARAAIASLAAG